MACQLSKSPLPGIWVIETLARSNQIDPSLLLDLVEKSPLLSDDLGRNARELVSLRILESFLVQGAPSKYVSTSSPKIGFDPSESCEEVLEEILLETSLSNAKAAGPDMWKWDIHPFIAHKRCSLDKHTLQKLKDAILSGSPSFFASLKDQSGLSGGYQPESVVKVDDDKCNSIKPGFDGPDRNAHISEGNDQLISPAPGDISYLLPSDLPNEDLLSVNRKRSATTDSAGGKSSKDQIISKNGCNNHLKTVKKHKNDVIHNKQDLGGKLISSGVNEELEDASKVVAQESERESCCLDKNTHVADVELHGPPADDSNEHISDLVGPTEVLPRENQVPHFDNKLSNDEEHGQENEIGELKGDMQGFSNKKSSENMDNFEQDIQENVPNGEEEENLHLSNGSQCTYRQDCLATKWRDLILLANISSRILQSSEVLGCSLGKQTCLGGMEQIEPGDGNNKFISSEALGGRDEILHHETQVCHRSTKAPNKNSDEEQGRKYDSENVVGEEGPCKLKTTKKYMDKFEQNFDRDMRNICEAKDVYISIDGDWYHKELIDIAKKKKAFLSSRCTYGQDSLATIDWRELNACVKCHKAGKLLVCNTKSCQLVIHENCLSSDAKLYKRRKFYCPFCAHSRAISKSVKIKKKVSLTRKAYATFICWGARKESEKQSYRSYKIKHFEQDEGLRQSNKLNNKDVNGSTNDHQHKRKSGYEQAGHSVLSFGDSLTCGGKTVASANGTPDSLKKDKQEERNTERMSQTQRVRCGDQMAALAILKSQGENPSCQVRGKGSEGESHADIRSRKRVLCSPETDLPHECNFPPVTESADAKEISEEENANSGASKYFVRVQSHKRQHSSPTFPQLRRIRVPWTTAEEEALKEGMRKFSTPHDRLPWKKVLEFGANIFNESRSTVDLKDKWRNLSKATPKP
ncbi:uncharacterized protein LOC105157969 isoform X1 [Sesamum indicum]|uniref:Uncharacterized protein LOC105157969 isoform X1 n=2 Tax=Sesamum indicum TaxID=4182 RepID=A0A6I9SS93_SESIN|nr:uncharacterized protein LOC105157969 isoform X1 [Sesamum indicum]XP_020548702.1 uncharacterized protein LOC105157969 isoform X1 [Sesamum indicum]XP_020548703.1 uncharacterized protein LOC105157969 isoform X1 [Sesamum indicum]XP_020548704.1 uncharacterized protein LOC105157969 isoform X1 [Sesamum indicum]XP_020548705.1 uncharacterized protein LOC105157969 isoform X1 [Sesamum indicum]